MGRQNVFKTDSISMGGIVPYAHSVYFLYVNCYYQNILSLLGVREFLQKLEQVGVKNLTYLKYDLQDERVQCLICTDETLGKLIEYIGNSELAIEKDGFQCLVKYIVGQQISDKARETIWKRTYTTFDDVPPEIIASINDSDLRKVSLSGNKVEYIRILAKSAIEKRIDFEKLQKLSNQDVIAELTSLKEIGWRAAEKYLIFSLERENVFSKGDGTIKRVIQWIYNLKELHSVKVLTSYFVNWTEYTMIVSSYLWKAIALGLTQKSFDTVISEPGAST